MTLAQMIVATGATRDWLHNSSRLLNVRVHRTPSGARWWSMVRLLSEIGFSLRASERAANAVLRSGVALNRIRLAASLDGSLAIQIDLVRFHSTANAALASALAFVPTRAVGRPRSRPAESPEDGTRPLEIRVLTDTEELNRVAANLITWDAYPRGIQRGLPFVLDAATLRAVPRLALTTTRGDVDVILEHSDHH